MAPSKNAATFAKDEKVLAFHGAYLYEAKVLDVSQQDPADRKSPWQYRIHYKGWKYTWDDTVFDDRLRKFDDANKELARQLQAEMKVKQREEREAKDREKKGSTTSHKKKSALNSELGSLRGSEERSSSVQAAPRGTKRNRDYDIEREDTYNTRPSVRIPLPDSLKSLLVDDWENVTKNLQLVPLPHPHPVTSILNDYFLFASSSKRHGSADWDILEEIVAGVREYFDRSLGRILLYRFEREQLHEVYARMSSSATGRVARGKGNLGVLGAEELDGGISLADFDFASKTLADIYGAEHLARLFASMPELIAQTNMDPQSVSRLREELTKMTGWLSKNAHLYFAKQYSSPGSEYEEKAKAS